MIRSVTLTAALLPACGSGSADDQPAPGEPLARRGDEIVVCGQLFHAGTPVVLWLDPGGYDAYRTVPRFGGVPGTRPTEKARYGTRRNLPPEIASRVAARGWALDDLQQVVQQFVLHYDATGLARRCFKVLHDDRLLSVHFMLDVDGTIYQTLDLKERAWHASQANDRSIGIEIAHVGGYPAPGHTYMRWYQRDDDGYRIRFPSRFKETGIRTPDFVARPSRHQLFEGEINGRHYYQYDFTEEQYRALGKLVATLHRVFPRIRLEYPRDDDGSVRTTALSDAELIAFEGVIGHQHVTERKADPGPAMDWERVMADARGFGR